MLLKSFIAQARLGFSRVSFGLLVLLLWQMRGLAAVYYVAPTGADSNPGNSNSPFATLMRAQSAAAANDTVYLRGGTYLLDNTNLTATNNPWAIVNNITKSRISYV